MEQEQHIQAAPPEKIKYTSDWTLWICYIILCVISVIEVFSASSLELKNGNVYLPITSHIKFLLGGFVLMFLIEHVRFKNIAKWSFPFAAFSILLAFITPIIGDDINGAVRSITVMGFSLQAAEFCKLANALLLAFFLSKFQLPDGKGLSDKGTLFAILIIGIFFGLLVTQGGSNAILVTMVGLTMIVLAVPSLKMKMWIGGCILLVVLLGYGAVKLAGGSDSQNQTPKEVAVKSENGDQTTVVMVSPNSSKSGLQKALRRLTVWEDRINAWSSDGVPEYEKKTTYGENSNSQRHHAYMAIAHGKGIGVMPGNSRECSRLQLAFSDFIYAIILEEMGLWGGLIVLACYLSIIIRACMISRKCKSAYASLLMMGMALVISYQAFYHMCISVGILPVSGQPLPFISKGGTSIIVMSIAMGVMLSVSRFSVQRTSEGLKTIEDDAELPQDLRADNPTGGY